MSTDAQQQHEMQLEKTYPSGAEEWFCPTCGRRFVLQWPPAYKKIVLEAGDEFALHTCGKGGLQLRSPELSESHEEQGEGDEEEEPVLSDELRAALEEVLANVDLDSWPSAAD